MAGISGWMGQQEVVINLLTAERKVFIISFLCCRAADAE
jgi:hypothetical protein